MSETAEKPSWDLSNLKPPKEFSSDYEAARSEQDEDREVRRLLREQEGPQVDYDKKPSYTPRVSAAVKSMSDRVRVKAAIKEYLDQKEALIDALMDKYNLQGIQEEIRHAGNGMYRVEPVVYLNNPKGK